jgi:hypothetical protein
MSTGIIIHTEPEVKLKGSYYLQNLASDFESVFYGAQGENWDLSPYLHCPESQQDEEEMREFEASEEEIAYMKLISSDQFYPVAEILERLDNAIEKVKTVDEEFFSEGKEGFLVDLEDLRTGLAELDAKTVKVQLLRG